jgi:hypothetical protein
VDIGERWPVRLVQSLRAIGISLDDPIIIAKTGWTTDELAAAIDAAAPVGPFELVSLLIGVNNQYQGRSADEYRRELTSLLGRAVQLAGDRPEHLLVLSIPDWGVTPFAARDPRGPIAIGAEIDEYNAVNRDEARRSGVRYVDVTPISRRADHDGSLIASDGLHPSGLMYALWTALILPEAAAVLSRSGM